MLHLALFLAAAVTASTSVDGHVTVIKRAAPQKWLEMRVTVPAPVSEVWKAFSTPEGMVTWLAPEAKVELRSGGDWLVGFANAKPGGGTVLAFVPEEMISLSAMAPEKFPTVRSERTMATFFFTPKGERETEVRLVQIGWKEGAEWDAAYDYLSRGNAMLLNTLHKRFTDGPIDWKK